MADIAPMETKPEVAEKVSSPNIERAQFTSGIAEHEPVDKLGPVIPRDDRPTRTLYYFTDIVNMAGETVTHRWEHDGRVMAEVSFNVGSESWRTWSSKDLTPAMEGSWQVVVSDSQGHVLKTDSFSYQGP